jgi:hypothetical protein
MREFEMGTGMKLMEIDDSQNLPRHSTSQELCYIPIYHLVESDQIREVAFWIQENGPFSTCWKNNGGNVFIVSDRYT